MIILRIARGKAWNHGNSLDENDDEADQLPSSTIGRLSFGSRPTRLVGVFGMDDVHPSAVAGGGGVKHEDGNVVELGLYSSKQSSVIDDVKA